MIIRSIIIDFLKEKSRLINEYIDKDANYITEADIAEVSGWSLSNCVKVIEEFATIDTNIKTTDDIIICPWCILYNLLHDQKCEGCGYRSRNGCCKNQLQSKYGIIISRIHEKNLEIGITKHRSSIGNISGMNDLVCRTVLICKDFLNKLME